MQDARASSARDDVLIVGAGPTGLVLALWLVRQGMRVRVVDAAAGPGTASRAMVVQARTLELYRQLDLAEAVVAAGFRNPAFNLWTGGRHRARVAFGEAGAGAGVTPYPFLLVYPQDRHERLLVERLAALGVEVERRTELLDFDDRGDHVAARLRGPDGAERTVEAAWLAGCDGARSVVRHRIGAGFPGGTYSKVFYVADVEARGAAANGEVNIALDQADFVAWIGYDDAGRGRLIGVVDDPDDEDGGAETARRFEDVGRRAMTDIGLEVGRVNWFSTYRVHHRVTDRYRQGRAFLLGDAAHIHSPAGGQGMNTGIGDAINLAWKLAAVQRGRAPDALLDSYEGERRPFAERLVATTDRVFSFVTADGGLADFVRLHLAPVLAPAAYSFEMVRAAMFRIVSQTQLSYHDGPISAGRAGDVRGGDRLPWIETVDNHAPLSAMAWQVHVYGTARPDLVAWCRAQGIALHRFGFDDAASRAGLAREAAYLIRPDTYVAVAAPDASVAALDGWRARHGLTLGQDPA
ncbi:MAG: FAD-dependent monooxygenase [Amaricoccus sp.]|uniref:FAD-dependent monooxygenase n=1 Tax=Amaricoccus sp. TaxID=1872485 RepID=UPI0039E6E69F